MAYCTVLPGDAVCTVEYTERSPIPHEIADGFVDATSAVDRSVYEMYARFMANATTTIRVSTGTRDRLMRARARDFGNASVDQIIGRLLDEHADELLREQMRQDSAHARHNAEDLEEVRRVQVEMDEFGAW